MASLISPITPSTRILDMGSGYGGPARYLAKKYGCKATCLNVSVVQNEKARQLAKEAGLEDLVTVLEGSFEDVPVEDHSFDVIWSQEAFLHSGNKAKIVSEIKRVLVPDTGKVVFADPMVAEGADESRLQPILHRLHLDGMASLDFYRKEFKKHGYEHLGFEERTQELVNHYGSVLRELEAREEELKGKMSDEYVKNMKIGLKHWVEGGQTKQLSWGIITFLPKS